jgi:hypothetical protein
MLTKQLSEIIFYLPERIGNAEHRNKCAQPCGATTQAVRDNRNKRLFCGEAYFGCAGTGSNNENSSKPATNPPI